MLKNGKYTNFSSCYDQAIKKEFKLNRTNSEVKYEDSNFKIMLFIAIWSKITLKCLASSMQGHYTLVW